MTNLADLQGVAGDGHAARQPMAPPFCTLSLELQGVLSRETLLDALHDLPQRHPALRDAGRFEPAADGTPWARLRELSPQVHELTFRGPGGIGDTGVLVSLAEDLGHLYTSRLLDVPPSPATRPRASDDAAAGSAPGGCRDPANGGGAPGDPPSVPVAAALPAGTRLPPDRDRSLHLSQPTASLALPIGDALASSVAAFAASHRTAECHVYLTAFAILLARFCGTSRVVIGLTQVEAPASRQPPPARPAGGLLLKTDVDTRRSGEEILQSIATSLEAALAAQPSSRPFPATGAIAGFSWPETLPVDGFEYLGLTVASARLEPALVSVGSCDTILSLSRGEGVLEATWRYDGQRFDAATIEGWLDSYCTLLRSLVNEAGSPAALMELASEAQIRRIASWNETPNEPASHALVHHWVAQRSQDASSKTAVVAEEGCLSHLELQRRSSRLARALRASGGTAGARIGLLLDPGLDAVVAQLAILKSGAACMPIDPELPRSHVERLIAHAEIDLLLTRSDRRSLPDPAGARILMLDRISALVARQDDSPLPEDEFSAGPDDAAFVIYGDSAGPGTDLPIATVLSHRAVTACLQGMMVRPGLGAGDRVVVSAESADRADRTGPGFSLELLAALGAGAEVVVAGGAERKDAQALRSLMNRTGANALRAGAATWRGLLDSGGKVASGLKAMVAASELDPLLAAALLGREVELWCFHEVRETTGWSASLRVDADSVPTEGGIDRRLIGRPAPGSEVWVFDDHGQVCPPGVPGELVFGGETLALGYLKDAPRTARMFVPDLVGAQAGRKLFRSGQSGRWRHDGCLELVLRSGPGARPVDRAAEAVEKREAAVDNPVQQPVHRSMQPVDKPPLAVEKPVDSLLEKRAQAVEKHVDNHVDNPVDRGVHKRGNKAANKGVDTKADTSAAGGHAEAAAEAGRQSNGARSNRLVARHSAETAGPLSVIQQGTWSLERRRPLAAARSIGSVHRFVGVLDEEALARAFDQVVERQAVLRTVVKERDGVGLQQVLPKATWCRSSGLFPALFPAEDLSALEPGKRDAFFRFRLDDLQQQPFDLERGPLFRSCMIRFSEREHVLVLVVHPIVADERSVALFFEDMSRLYGQFAEGGPAVLQPLATSYLDVAAAERVAMPVALAAPQTEPHFDRAASEQEGGRRHAASVVLPRDLSGRIRSLAMQESALAHDVYLAAWYVTAGCLGRREGVVVQWAADTRFEPELLGLAGPFTTCVRLSPAARPQWPFVTLMRAVAAIRSSFASLPGPTFSCAAPGPVSQEAGPADADDSGRPWTTVLRYHDAVAGSASWGDLGYELRMMSRSDDADDIAVTLIDGNDGLLVSLEFASGSAAFESMARIADLYRRVLEAAVRNPEQRLEALTTGLPVVSLGSPPSRLLPPAWSAGVGVAAQAADTGAAPSGQVSKGHLRREAVVFACLVAAAAVWAIAEGYLSGAGL